MLKDWTIDTYVLYKAADIEGDAIELLNQIRRKRHQITLDYEGHIEKEYKECLQYERNFGRDFVSKWFKEVIGKFAQYCSGKLQKRHQIALQKRKFDRSDWPFVAVCSKTKSKKLVSEDSDYTENVKCYLQSEMAINVLSIRDSLEV